MALELNGTTGVSAVQAGAVESGDLETNLDLSSKNLTLPNGSVSNFSQNTDQSVITLTSTTYQNVISTSITPQSLDSKILILVNTLHRNDSVASPGRTYSAIFRNSTELFETREEIQISNHIIGLSFIDTPNTTSSITYNYNVRLQDGGSLTINDNGATIITALELKV